MAPTGSDIIRIWFEEVWNKGRAEAIDEYTAPGWVGHGLALPGDPALSRQEKFKAFHKDFRSAFPDVKIDVGPGVSDGDFSSAHCSVRATHAGEGLGFPATGKTITFTGLVMVRSENGKIVESWEGWNFLDMYKQLGLNPI